MIPGYSDRPIVPPDLRSAILGAAGDRSCFVVGGTVRDWLLGRQSTDLDIIVADRERELAQRLAALLGGALAPLDPARGIYRVALPRARSGIHHLDVARFRAGTLEADLAGRDFTVNAIALGVADGTIFDPLGGQHDLDTRVLRVAGPDAIGDDPLRALRAIRFSAELGFEIEPGTAAIIRRDASRLAETAGERQRDELLRVMETPAAAGALRRADDLGVLDAVIPEIQPAKGCSQPKEHYYDVFNHLIETVAVLDLVLAAAAPARSETYGRYQLLWEGLPEPTGLQNHLSSVAGEGRTRRAVLKLVGLLHDISKPETKARQANGRIRFFGHAELGAEKTAAIFERLRLTAKETAYAALLVREHLRPGQLSHGSQLPTRRALYRFFRDLGDAAADVLLLNLADHAAARGPLMSPNEWAGHAAYIHWILKQRATEETLVRPPRLVTGHDLIDELGLTPGPQLGEILEAIREAQASNRIRTREAALRLASRLARARIEKPQTVRERSPSPENLSS